MQTVRVVYRVPCHTQMCVRFEIYVWTPKPRVVSPAWAGELVLLTDKGYTAVMYQNMPYPGFLVRCYALLHMYELRSCHGSHFQAKRDFS